MSPAQPRGAARAGGAAEPVLRVRGLSVRYGGAQQAVHAVNDVSFDLLPGRILGIVGESGSGKSTVARALLRLLPSGARTTGQVLLGGVDLLGLRPRELRSLRWSRMSMIFQDAMTALNPVFTVGQQLVETIRLHDPMGKAAARARAGELLEFVGIAPARLDSYPHQLSGGMRQRICIASAFAHNPEVVIADEPTTALDVLTQDQIIENMLGLQRAHDQAIIFITHDIALVTEIADDIGVMYGGQLVEIGRTEDILGAPAHPYTMGLLNALPSLESHIDRLVSIPGTPKRLSSEPTECTFLGRCPFAEPRCAEEVPPAVPVSATQASRCLLVEDAAGLRLRARDPDTWGDVLERDAPRAAADRGGGHG